MPSFFISENMENYLPQNMLDNVDCGHKGHKFVTFNVADSVYGMYEFIKCHR